MLDAGHLIISNHPSAQFFFFHLLSLCSPLRSIDGMEYTRWQRLLHTVYLMPQHNQSINAVTQYLLPRTAPGHLPHAPYLRIYIRYTKICPLEVASMLDLEVADQVWHMAYDSWFVVSYV
jgi:hypothetical protein